MTHLYIASRGDRPGVLKVGRSDRPHRRAKELSSEMGVAVSILATFAEGGRVESAVHSKLRDARAHGPGREWFHVDLAFAAHAVVASLQQGGEAECEDESLAVPRGETEEEPRAVASPPRGEAMGDVDRPPCRAAGRYMTECPNCRRPLTVKHLRYAHRCGRSWDVDARAVEQNRVAKEAFLSRERARKESAEKLAAHRSQAHPLSPALPRMPPIPVSAAQLWRRRWY